MKKYAILTLILISIIHLYGQTGKQMAEGKVSYITLQNIYVKFEQAGMVHSGDTIFFLKSNILTPLFVAESVSSSSCVGKPIEKVDVQVSDTVYFRMREIEKKVKENIPQLSGKTDTTQILTAGKIVRKPVEVDRKEKIRGRIGLSSYSSFSNTSDVNQRMRYTFSLGAQNISDGRFSFDSYVLFTHKLDHWAEVKDNIFNALKIYSLNVSYDIGDKTHLSIGRKINPRIASIGAVDGLQGETSAGNFTFGAVVGTNPDYSDYSFNSKLFEYGGYLAYGLNNSNGNFDNSLAFFEQTSHGKTDRRFVYFQQDNSLIKNINLFASTELDLYTVKDSVPANTISLTSLYLSLRFRISKQLSIYASYDARKNVIYYETFKSYLDQMLEDATRQGYQCRMNYRPSNSISAGVTGGYRFMKNDINPMKNVNGFITFQKVPFANSSLSFSTNWLQTSYVNGLIYSVQLYHDIIPSKLNMGLYYRYVDNEYLNASTKSQQHMGELELSWQVSRKFSISANYDGTFEKGSNYSSVYINLIKRF